MNINLVQVVKGMTFSLLSLVIGAQASLLGIAGDYNAFAFGDILLSTSDSEGKVAGQGNVSMNSYSIGEKSAPSLFSLISGNDLSFTSDGTIFNGGLYAGGKATLTRATVNGNANVVGNITLNSTTIRGSVNTSGTLTKDAGSTITGTPQTGTNPGSCPINFGDVKLSLSATATKLASTISNGTIINDYGTRTLTGNDAVNYFSLSATELNNTNGLNFDLVSDAVAIINVSGSACNLRNFAFKNIDGTDFINSENILFNFYEAATLDIASIGVKGSILAKDANITFNNSHIDGNMIGKSITGSGEFHNKLFGYDFPSDPPKDVPEPNVFSLFLFGTAVLSFFTVRRKKSN